MPCSTCAMQMSSAGLRNACKAETAAQHGRILGADAPALSETYRRYLIVPEGADAELQFECTARIQSALTSGSTDATNL